MFINWSPIRKLIWLKASGAIVPDLPWKTITGNPLSFIARTAHALKSCVVGIEPVQSGSGDPSPDNVRPISGFTGANVTRTGINIWDEQWESGSIGGADGQPTPDDTRIRSKNFCACLPSTQYYCVNSLGTLNVGFYDANKNYISMSGNATNNTFTTPANCRWFKIRVVATTYSSGVSINYPASERTYHASNVSTVPITWNTEAGTVYGGTLDVTTGVLTVDRAMINMSTITGWNTDKTAQRCYKVLSQIAPASAASVVADGLICNRFKSITADQIYAKIEGVAISVGSALQFHITGVTDDANMTATTISNYFANNSTDVVCKLATPQTYQLTAQQVSAIVGENNMWTDCATLTVEAKAMD